VRAKGENCRLYGIGADDVNDMMQVRYEKGHKDSMAAVTKIIDSGSCEQFNALNAFQRHELFMNGTVKQYESGQLVVPQGDEWLTEVVLLLQGSMIMRREDGTDLGRVKRYMMQASRGVLFGSMPYSLIADGSVKVLAISKDTLNLIFGADKLATYIMLGSINRRLNESPELAEVAEEQRCELGACAKIVPVPKDGSFDTTNLRFLMCLCLDIEVSTDGFKDDIRKFEAKNLDFVGMSELLQKTPWTGQVRSADPDHPAFVAKWVSEDVDPKLASNEQLSKFRILRTVFLFRTLSKVQLEDLANAMETKKFEADGIIFKQGDFGDSFSIIAKGRVFVERNDRFIRSLGPGDYFGDRALLTQEARSATIKTSSVCEIWTINAETFTKVMSPTMMDHMSKRIFLQDTEYRLEQLTYERVIGTGGYGVVKLVTAEKGSARYAFKAVRKQPIVQHDLHSTVVNERDVMMQTDHPFIIRLVQTFRNKAYIYFLLELVTGGELLQALGELGGVLDQPQTQFYAGSIILALEYLHDRRVAYLDLKSENVMLDSQGFIKLVDFGQSRKVEGGLYGVKGTPHFMAPEMMSSKQPYWTTADLWALGVCVYEFMVGSLPFGANKQAQSEIFTEVLQAAKTGNIPFPSEFLVKPHAIVSRKFIEGLLVREPSKRIGGGMDGYKEFHQHQFFAGVHLDDYLARRVTPPFVPKEEMFGAKKQMDSEAGTSLAKVEMNAEKKELAKGWTDPDPGWDDEFGNDEE
jgi:cGMP-dependent protein kinase